MRVAVRRFPCIVLGDRGCVKSARKKAVTTVHVFRHYSAQTVITAHFLVLEGLQCLQFDVLGDGTLCYLGIAMTQQARSLNSQLQGPCCYIGPDSCDISCDAQVGQSVMPTFQTRTNNSSTNCPHVVLPDAVQSSWQGALGP